MSKIPNKWTPEEDLILHSQVVQAGEHGPKDWTAIAAALPGRTNKDCRKRWCNHLVSGIQKGSWEADEDERLLAAVAKFGQHWPSVAEAVGSRSADQCAKRWKQALDPTLDRSKWSHREQRTLLRAVKDHGRVWKYIQEQYFPERATNNVKNRYMTLTRRESVDVDTVLKRLGSEEDERLRGASRGPAERDIFSEITSEGFSTSNTNIAASTAAQDSTQLVTADVDDLNLFLPPANINLDSFETEFSAMDFSLNHTPYLPSSSSVQGHQSGDSVDLTLPSSRSSIDCISAMEVDDQNAVAPKFVLSIVDPSTEMVRDLMGMMVTSKTKFKSEMLYGY